MEKKSVAVVAEVALEISCQEVASSVGPGLKLARICSVDFIFKKK